MSSTLVRFDGGDWTSAQPGKIHGSVTQTYSTGGHQNIWISKNIDPNLVGKDCLICCQLTIFDFTVAGSFCAGLRTSSGFTSQIQTFYSNREWTGGASFPGGARLSGNCIWQLVARPNASTIGLQVRIDMSGAGNYTVLSEGDNQSNVFVFPVHY